MPRQGDNNNNIVNLAKKKYNNYIVNNIFPAFGLVWFELFDILKKSIYSPVEINRLRKLMNTNE